MKTENAKHLHTIVTIDFFQIFNELQSDIMVQVQTGKPEPVAPGKGTAIFPVRDEVETNVTIPGIPVLELAITPEGILLLNPSSGWSTPSDCIFEYVPKSGEKYQVLFAEKNSDGGIGIAMVGTVSTVRES